MAEEMIEVDGVTLCTERFGDGTDETILLVMGLGASMLWWGDDFCRRLADAGRSVIRYDHRDTGRSMTSEPGRPDYSGDDLVDDAVRVLDACGVTAAHVVGVSAGGGIAQVLAVTRPRRVRSLVLVSTSPATGGDRALPPPSPSFRAFDGAVDWSDAGSVVEYLVAYSRVLSGGQRPFDVDAHRALVERDVARTRCVAALQNHDLLQGSEDSHPAPSSITAPTLVIHGTADPLFPAEHGAALAAEIPGARLLLIDGAGHGIDPADEATIAAAIVEHTATLPP